MDETIPGQDRWNTAYGKDFLSEVERRPNDFIVSEHNRNLGGWTGELVLLNALGDLNGKRVLEYGCGQGRLSVLMAKRGARVTSLDLGPDLVKLASRVAQLNGVTIEYIVGDISQAHFSPGSFDLVVGDSILHHLTVKGARMAIEQAFKALRSGGCAFFLEPVENSPTFEFLQNLVPLKGYRPSILNRKAWKDFLARADDRSMSDREFREAIGEFARVDLHHMGLTVRLARVFKALERPLEAIDEALMRSPLKRFAQNVIVTYYKG
jgi:2-polyprenyl-3-methyl-5-hydroxy-6-metoxy-1,4-benzoquinol methylase